MKKWQQAIHGTMMVVAFSNAIDSIVAPAFGQQAVNVVNANSNGQSTLASSSPVAPASNWINDPCFGTNTKTNVPISTSNGSTQLVAGAATTNIYVCSFSLIAGAATVVNIIEGTGSTCATATADLGSTTSTSGMSLAANGGLTLGNGGGTVIRTTNASASMCFLQSSTALVGGNLTYVRL